MSTLRILTYLALPLLLVVTAGCSDLLDPEFSGAVDDQRHLGEPVLDRHFFSLVHGVEPEPGGLFLSGGFLPRPGGHRVQRQHRFGKTDLQAADPQRVFFTDAVLHSLEAEGHGAEALEDDAGQSHLLGGGFPLEGFSDKPFTTMAPRRFRSI